MTGEVEQVWGEPPSLVPDLALKQATAIRDPLAASATATSCGLLVCGSG